MNQSSKKTPNMSRTPAKRKLRNYLIDRHFQLKWMFRVIAVATIIVAVMGYFLYQTVSDATDQMLAQKLGDSELTEDSMVAFQSQAERDKKTTIYTLIASLILLVAFISLATIALTHKIAGPIYRMRKIFATINGDNLRLWERLRKGDELKEAFDDFDDMLRRLRESRREDVKLLEAAKKAIEDCGGDKEQIMRLKNMIENYKESVKMT